MNHGEYIIKLENITDHLYIRPEQDTCKIEILQWGKINTGSEREENKNIRMDSISKIYEPEPDKFPIYYENSKFTEIPEWLFSKKVTSKVMSRFRNSTGLTSIPEGLFKNNVNVTSFNGVFSGCSGITSIPEELFKNNVNVTSFTSTFSGCIGLTSIPEGLFKNNVNAEYFHDTFSDCTGLTNIPERLFEHNVKARMFERTFLTCTGLTSIPEKIIELGKKVKEKGGDVSRMFSFCTSASNYNSLPDYMK